MLPAPLLKSLLLNRVTLGILALALTMLVGYNWAYNRGKASQAPVIASLKAEKQKLEDVIEDKRLLALAQEEAYQKSLTLAKEANRATLAVLRVDLDRSQAETRKLKEKLNAKISQYVTAKADASCSITAGFVRLHNLAASEDSSGTAQDSSTAGSGPEDADTPTTLKISTLGETITSNYAECKARLDTITAWQLWYRESKANMDRAIQQQLDYQKSFVP